MTTSFPPTLILHQPFTSPVFLLAFLHITFHSSNCYISKSWLIIKVVVSFGLQPENLLEEMLSYLTCIYLIMDSRTKNFLAYIQTTSCLQVHWILLYILSWSIRIDSPSLIWVYSASQTVTWYVHWDYILVQYVHNCIPKTIQMAHRCHQNTSHWNFVVFQNTAKHIIFLKTTPHYILLCVYTTLAFKLPQNIVISIANKIPCVIEKTYCNLFFFRLICQIVKWHWQITEPFPK